MTTTWMMSSGSSKHNLKQPFLLQVNQMKSVSTKVPSVVLVKVTVKYCFIVELCSKVVCWQRLITIFYTHKKELCNTEAKE